MLFRVYPFERVLKLVIDKEAHDPIRRCSYSQNNGSAEADVSEREIAKNVTDEQNDPPEKNIRNNRQVLKEAQHCPNLSTILKPVEQKQT
jgi:hypothetical protein